MTTIHLGIEELIARRQNAAMEQTVRDTWRLTDFWRMSHKTAQRDVQPAARSWRGELVEWGVTYARLAMF